MSVAALNARQHGFLMRSGRKSMSHRGARRLFFFFASTIWLLSITCAFAQSTATIQGTVTDPTGAAIPNATVTIKNQATGEERTTQTDSAGIYVAPSLTVGT